MSVDIVEGLVALAFFAGAGLVGLPIGLLLGATVRSTPLALPSRRDSEVAPGMHGLVEKVDRANGTVTFRGVP